MTSSEPNPKNNDGQASPSGRVVSTGNFWSDLGPALKKVSVSDGISNIGQIPCARNSLMSGIASGVGIGFVRGLSAGPWVACNWAVGTFIFVSLGTWHICRARIANEHKRMQVIVDSLPRLRRKRPEELEKDIQQNS